MTISRKFPNIPEWLVDKVLPQQLAIMDNSRTTELLASFNSRLNIVQKLLSVLEFAFTRRCSQRYSCIFFTLSPAQLANHRDFIQISMVGSEFLNYSSLRGTNIFSLRVNQIFYSKLLKQSLKKN